MKNLFNDIKLTKAAYLLEIIEKKDIDSKLKAYNKLKKINITEEVGLLIIENLYKDYGLNDENGGINSALAELCFKNYYDNYTLAIYNIFKDLDPKLQDRILILLTTTNNKSAIELYSKLVLKFYKNKDFIPIGNLINKKEYYNILFPDLFKALKFKNYKNNILFLFNEYLNYGVVLEDDLKKNKKIITDTICKIFDEALMLKIKFNNTFEALSDQNYMKLRLYLEICLNIEVYVSNKKTTEYINRLYRKNDNQLKLFIIDNYYRKGYDISKYNINKIAKDNASRYALFELLNLYDKTNLMPKKYLDQKLLAESDFYTNFVIVNRYNYEPKNIEFYSKVNVNGYDYYVFKFDFEYEYNNLNNDFLTNYICNIVGIEKYNGRKITNKFIGISGGYNKDKEISLIEHKHNSLLTAKINDNSDIEKIVNDLIFQKQEYTINTKQERNIFQYILLILLSVFTLLLVFSMFYVNNKASTNNNFNKNTLKSVKINKQYEFNEIDAKDIFNKPESEYYVLFYKKNDNNKSIYFNYINEYLKRNIKFYYVNLNDEKNKFIKEDNNLNFIVSNDRLLKVKDKEYEYYIDGKSHILNEMKTEINKFIEIEKTEK